MCGRFSQAQIAELDREVFELLSVPRLEPRYNVAPTQDAAVVRVGRTRERELVPLRWGLIPSWAKDSAIGNRMINARAETLAEKPAFREAFAERRCLVPADGFYEWEKMRHRKQPHYVRVGGGQVFAFAGLWERWWDRASGAQRETFTIVTTEPNTLLEPIHNRMPVIIAPDDYDRWLDPENRDAASLSDLLAPYPPERMSAYPVSTYVNKPENEGPECVRPLDQQPDLLTPP
jgi:putative SOS response-associated peptidase YedK